MEIDKPGSIYNMAVSLLSGKVQQETIQRLSSDLGIINEEAETSWTHVEINPETVQFFIFWTEKLWKKTGYNRGHSQKIMSEKERVKVLPE